MDFDALVYITGLWCRGVYCGTLKPWYVYLYYTEPRDWPRELRSCVPVRTVSVDVKQNIELELNWLIPVLFFFRPHISWWKFCEKCSCVKFSIAYYWRSGVLYLKKEHSVFVYSCPFSYSSCHNRTGLLAELKRLVLNVDRAESLFIHWNLPRLQGVDFVWIAIVIYCLLWLNLVVIYTILGLIIQLPAKLLSGFKKPKQQDSAPTRIGWCLVMWCNEK